MKLRFYNARILTPNGIINGELHTDGARISHIGGGGAQGFDREIDLGGDLIIPGFKNAHTHTAMTFLRLQSGLTAPFSRERQSSRRKRYTYSRSLA